MLGKLEELSLTPTLESMAEAVDLKDFAMMKSKAHSLKGSSGYIGASNLHYSCFHIQQCYHAGNYERMLDYYPLLIESCIEFKVESKKVMAKYNGR